MVTAAGRLRVVLALNLVLVAGLLVVGVSAHSLGVLAEGVDYLADAAAIGVSLAAIRLAALPPSERHPDGFPRASTVAALINAGWLLILCVLVAAGSVDRLLRGAREVHGLPVLIVSGIAAAVMFGGALLLGGDADDRDNDSDGDEPEDLNMQAVLLDTAGDAAAAAGVAVAGAVILSAGGLYWLDPATALVISVVVGGHAAVLLRRIGGVLRAAKVPMEAVCARERRSSLPPEGAHDSVADAGDEAVRR